MTDYQDQTKHWAEASIWKWISIKYLKSVVVTGTEEESGHTDPSSPAYCFSMARMPQTGILSPAISIQMYAATKHGGVIYQFICHQSSERERGHITLPNLPIFSCILRKSSLEREVLWKGLNMLSLSVVLPPPAHTFPSTF